MSKRYIGSVRLKQFGQCDIVRGIYGNDALAIFLEGTGDGNMKGERICSLSVNIPPYSETLADGQFFAKTYHENSEIAKQCMETGLFEEVGLTFPSGHISVPLWKLKGK
jgi:hypothetical protein